MQARFDFDSLGDVHQRALHADGPAEGVANGKSRSQTMDVRSVFAAEDHIHVLHRALMDHLVYQGVALCGVRVNFTEIQLLQFLFALVSQHANERRIGIEQCSFRSGEENSFAQRFEQLGKANFGFVL
jgi:hypothetical protein